MLQSSGPQGWLTRLLSGEDNQTPAIGRVIGAAAFLALVIGVPAVIVGVFIARKVPDASWFALLATLQTYAPLIIASLTALIRFTNSTEPKRDP